MGSKAHTEIGLSVILVPAIGAVAGLIVAIYFNYVPIDTILMLTGFLLLLSLPYWSWQGGKNMHGRFLLFAVFSFLITLFAAVKIVIGKVDLQAILFHIEFGVSGLDAAFTYKLGSTLGGLWLIAVVSIFQYSRYSRYGMRVLYGFISVCILANPLFYSGLKNVGYRVGLLDTLNRPELQQIYSPMALSSDVESRKNLIIVYVEGLERTYENQAVFGDIYGQITELEADSVVFSNVGQITSTGWTIAGLVASQCGVPLLRNGVFFKNNFEEGAAILPNVVCLGDILSQAGYSQEFVLGSSPEFAGKDLFLRNHGFDTIIGDQELADIAPNDRNQWGLFDDDLLDVVKRRIVALEHMPAPYHLEVLTIGAHGYGGFVSKNCREEAVSAVTENILEAVACINRNAAEFVETIKSLVDMENTLIVLLSDHLAHGNNVSGTLNKLDRRNTAIFIGAGLAPQLIAKQGSMIDIFPTILDVLDVQMFESRAGLGVSLFSDRPTLLEQFELEAVDAALTFDKAFAHTLWEE